MLASTLDVDLCLSGEDYSNQHKTKGKETDTWHSGCFLMCVFNICLGSTAFFHTVGAGKAALGFLLLWVICYGASAGPIGFVAAGETSTPRLRAQTTSFNLGCYGLGL